MKIMWLTLFSIHVMGAEIYNADGSGCPERKVEEPLFIYFCLLGHLSLNGMWFGVAPRTN